MPVLPLRTARLTLRLMRPDAAPTVTAYRNDPDVARYQDWDIPYPEERTRTMLAAQAELDDVTAGQWVQIAVEHDGVLVGDAAVGIDPTGSVATIGYTLAAEHQGRGYASEAAAALVDALFAETAVHRILATLDPANAASLRILETLGFQREGLARKSEPIRGEWLDDLRYGLLKEDRAAWVARPMHRPTTVELVPVTEDNLRKVKDLETFWFQRAFVAPMEWNLAQALVPGTEHGHPVMPWFRAIVADGEIAGFIMLAAPATGNPLPYMWRFLIDRRHQRRGIGRSAVARLVEHFAAEGFSAMLTSWEEGRGGPRPFYEGLGFVPTGEFDDDEVIAKLEFSDFRP